MKMSAGFRIGAVESWRAWAARGFQGAASWWASFGLVLIFAAVWMYAPHTGRTVRLVGLGYEFVGVVAVVIELVRSMLKHGIEWPHVQLWRYLRAVPLRQRHYNVKASPIDLSATLGSATLTAHGRTTATLEQRVEALEGALAKANERINEVGARIDAEKAAREKAIADEAHRRERNSQELRDAITQIEVGSLALSFFGVVWLLVGMILTTGTEEVCEWLLRCAR